jgi:hypothetical protein
VCHNRTLIDGNISLFHPRVIDEEKSIVLYREQKKETVFLLLDSSATNSVAKRLILLDDAS